MKYRGNTTEDTTSMDERAANSRGIWWLVLNLVCYWKGFLLTILLALLAGYVYLHYTTQVYQLSAGTVLQASKSGDNSNSDILNVQTEIDILDSRDLIENVVTENGYYTNYVIKDKLKDTELYNAYKRRAYRVPVRLLVDSLSLAQLEDELTMKVKRTRKGSIKVSGSYGEKSFTVEADKLPVILPTPIGDLLLSDGDDGYGLTNERSVSIVVNPAVLVAQRYLNALHIEQKAPNSSVIRITLDETNQSRGASFLYDLIETYNTEKENERNGAFATTLAFIDQRLADVQGDLSVLEKNIQVHKQKNTVVNVKQDFSFAFARENDYRKELPTDGSKDYLSSQGNLNGEIRQDDSYGGLESDSLNEAIRQDSLTNIISLEEPDENIILKKQDDDKNKMRDTRTSPINIKAFDGYLVARLADYGSGLLERDRLLQEKQRIELAMALSVPAAKIVESPLATDKESPQRSSVYLWCLLFGFVFPYLVLALRTPPTKEENQI
ncbi:hypothetical protein AGMMS49982_08780 [Bacteroidia bacterium]|nr:hypothetical protein AGMMS49982_08780 [Bacteroidia bacterium]